MDFLIQFLINLLNNYDSRSDFVCLSDYVSDSDSDADSISVSLTDYNFFTEVRLIHLKTKCFSAKNITIIVNILNIECHCCQSNGINIFYNVGQTISFRMNQNPNLQALSNKHSMGLTYLLPKVVISKYFESELSL